MIFVNPVYFTFDGWCRNPCGAPQGRHKHNAAADGKDVGGDDEVCAGRREHDGRGLPAAAQPTEAIGTQASH